MFEPQIEIYNNMDLVLKKYDVSISLVHRTQLLSITFKPEDHIDGIKRISGLPYTPCDIGKIDRYHQTLYCIIWIT